MTAMPIIGKMKMAEMPPARATKFVEYRSIKARLRADAEERNKNSFQWKTLLKIVITHSVICCPPNECVQGFYQCTAHYYAGHGAVGQCMSRFIDIPSSILIPARIPS